MMSSSEFVVHQDPVWRDRSDFVISAKLPERDRPSRFEQLFAKQVDEGRLQICCIPFFVYDMALGDAVATAPRGNRKYVVCFLAEQERMGRLIYDSGRS